MLFVLALPQDYSPRGGPLAIGSGPSITMGQTDINFLYRQRNGARMLGQIRPVLLPVSPSCP